MMKDFSFSFYLLSSILIGTFVMAACSSHDEDNDENESSVDKSKRIVRIVEAQSGYDGDGTENTYTYDTQGRIVSVKGVGYYAGKTENYETSYYYDQNSIQSHYQEHYQEGIYSVEHNYTLSNGLIVKDFVKSVGSGHIYTYTISFKYDDNGYLVSIVENNQGEVYSDNVNWKNGDIVNIGKWSYTYSDVNWNKNMIFYIYSDDIDANLIQHGYWGKLPKHMPSSSITYDSKVHKYEYTFENGLISKISKIKEEGNVESEITIFWE